MSTWDIAQSIIDKVVIGTIATVVSLLALHGYNSHLKAFDSAQPSARSMSDLAVKKKDELLSSIKELVSIANGVIFNVPKYSSVNEDAAIRLQIAEIFTNRHMLGSNLSQTAECFGGIEGKFDKEIRANYDPRKKILRMAPDSFGAFVEEITEAQDKCVEVFNRELVDLLSRQYDQTYESFYKNAPWYERPDCLLVAAVAAMFAALGLSLLLQSVGSAPSDT
jgi:hypothetical protein